MVGGAPTVKMFTCPGPRSSLSVLRSAVTRVAKDFNRFQSAFDFHDLIERLAIRLSHQLARESVWDAPGQFSYRRHDKSRALQFSPASCGYQIKTRASRELPRGYGHPMTKTRFVEPGGVEPPASQGRG
jgi:hypothetical protein